MDIIFNQKDQNFINHHVFLGMIYGNPETINLSANSKHNDTVYMAQNALLPKY